MKNKIKHTKHTQLIKPGEGVYARFEWAIMGAPCHKINSLCLKIAADLQAEYQVGYMDAEHKELPFDLPYATYFSDKIDFARIDHQQRPNNFDLKDHFSQLDVLLVNGNHFIANRQILILNSRKKDSLQRKLDRISQVDLILIDDVPQVFDFLQELDTIKDAPVLDLSDENGIYAHLRKQLQEVQAPLWGLVLAGGKSTRMGKDKASLNYHGKEQKEYLLEIIKPCVQQAYLSVRPEQVKENSQLEEKLLPDTFTGLGPFGAICSAFRKQPDTAWLLVACDLPFVGSAAIQHLINHRDPSKVATAFLNPATGFPDPLLTIYEPKAYPRLLQFLWQGYACPRKMLINSDVQVIEVPDDKWLKNVNTFAEFEEISKQLLVN